MNETFETTGSPEDNDLKVLLRPMRREDIPLVTNSWMKNARKCYAYKGCPSAVYDKQHHRIIARLIPRCVMIIACNERDPSEIYGWTCAEVIDNFLVVHYVWVRERLKSRHDLNQEGRKGFGVGTMMLQPLLKHPHLRGLVYTEETQAGKYWLQHLHETGRLQWEPVYNPFQLYASFYEGQ